MRVQLTSSDVNVRNWVSIGKFAVPVDPKGDATKLANAVAGGVIDKVVRASIVKGARQKGKLTHRIRIENASPLRLNGLAATGPDAKPDDSPRTLNGISIPPRRSMSLPASEEVIKNLGLKNGIRITALDLSGL